MDDIVPLAKYVDDKTNSTENMEKEKKRIPKNTFIIFIEFVCIRFFSDNFSFRLKEWIEIYVLVLIIIIHLNSYVIRMVFWTFTVERKENRYWRTAMTAVICTSGPNPNSSNFVSIIRFLSIILARAQCGFSLSVRSLFVIEFAYLHGLHHWFCWSKPNLARHFFILLPRYHHWCEAQSMTSGGKKSRQTIFLALDQ